MSKSKSPRAHVRVINQEFMRFTEAEIRRNVIESQGDVLAFAAPDGSHVMVLQNDDSPLDAYGEDRVVFCREGAVALAKGLNTWLEKTQSDWDEHVALEARTKEGLNKSHDLVRKCHAEMAAQLRDTLPRVFEAVHKSVEDQLSTGDDNAVILGMVYDHWQSATKQFLTNALPQDVSPHGLTHHLFSCVPGHTAEETHS